MEIKPWKHEEPMALPHLSSITEMCTGLGGVSEPSRLEVKGRMLAGGSAGTWIPVTTAGCSGGKGPPQRGLQHGSRESSQGSEQLCVWESECLHTELMQGVCCI